MRYLKGTVEYGLKYDMNQKINLEGYVDLYWEGNAIDRKNTSRYYFNMRSVWQDGVLHGAEYSQGKRCFHLLFGR